MIGKYCIVRSLGAGVFAETLKVCNARVSKKHSKSGEKAKSKLRMEKPVNLWYDVVAVQEIVAVGGEWYGKE